MRRRTGDPKNLTSSPAATLAERHDAERSVRRRLWAKRSKRASVAMLLFLFSGVIVSGYFSQIGTRTCSDEGICVVKKWHPLSIYPRIETEVDAETGAAAGMFRQWHYTGYVEFEGQFASGKRDGLWREWFANGTPRFVGTYDAGKHVGKEMWWYANGQAEWAGAWKAGLRDGPETWWWPNGNVRRLGQFTEGEKTGGFYVYKPSGVLRFLKDHDA